MKIFIYLLIHSFVYPDKEDKCQKAQFKNNGNKNWIEVIKSPQRSE